jgi:DeoR/GlpR family transcriptional regulator of sugar metabolism
MPAPPCRPAGTVDQHTHGNRALTRPVVDLDESVIVTGLGGRLQNRLHRARSRVVCSDLTVVTNALHAAITVREGGSRVIVLGGLLTPELSLVNPGIVQEPPQVHLDLLVLGCGGLSVDRGITYFDPTEVEVRRLLAGLADRVVVAADHTKFDRKKAMVLGPLELVDVLVTDRTPPEPLRSALADAGVEVVIAT